jgi:vacuolar-type H+-ATPase subunit D/Vma8
MRRLAHALDGLEKALRTPPRLQQSWRYLVKQRLTWVEAALAADPQQETDPWLEPRLAQLQRERVRLRSHVSLIASTICDATDLAPVRESLARLVHDLEHYQQRVNDLAYDAVDLDVGGSE